MKRNQTDGGWNKVFRISPGIPNVTDYNGDCNIIQYNIMIL